MLMRPAFFWDITQRRVVKDYHSTLRNIPEERRSQFKDCLTLVRSALSGSIRVDKNRQTLQPIGQDSCVVFVKFCFRIAAGKWVGMLIFFLTLRSPTRQVLVRTESDRFLPRPFRRFRYATYQRQHEPQDKLQLLARMGELSFAGTI
jgi:hypothetical protein